MEIIKNPQQKQWELYATRPALDISTLFKQVQDVINDVRKEGDIAVKRYSELFDNVSIDNLLVSQEEIQEAEQLISEKLKKAIFTAKENIQQFHAAQCFKGISVETSTGVKCWQKSVAIEKVGLYIPGGTAPLFSSVLMLAIPANIAGCKEIILCTPPNKKGKIHPAILYAAQVAGVHKIFKIGGIQAIAAMAYGTTSVPAVYKIFGPGNQYVTAAKQLVSLKQVAIDMPAGPSEVAIIADAEANANYIAADFLSQAEHGKDSQSILVTNSEALIEKVQTAIKEQLQQLSRKEITAQALENSKIILFEADDDMIDFINLYAPEHLIIQTQNYIELSSKVVNAGSVFMGPYTPESAGDYASGTNHTLPTNGYARAYSGVNLDSFTKKITFQEISAKGLQQLGETIQEMAASEQLDAHKNAVTIRLENL